MQKEYSVWAASGKAFGITVKDDAAHVGANSVPVAGSRAEVEEHPGRTKNGISTYIVLYGPEVAIAAAVKPRDESKARLWAWKFNQYSRF